MIEPHLFIFAFQNYIYKYTQHRATGGCWVITTTVVKICHRHSPKQYCSSPHRRAGRGQQSSLAFKGTCNKKGCPEKSWFWQGKKGVFYTTIEKFLTKACYRLFIKTRAATNDYFYFD